MPDERETVVPLHEERISVSAEKIETGRVRVDVRVHEHDEVVEQILKRRDIEIERVPIGQPVDSAPEIRQEGETIIVPVVEEEIVVSKRLVLREEIHIRPKTIERTERVPVTRRAEYADVTRTDMSHNQRDDSEVSNG